MSDKKLTPIQEAIKRLSEELYSIENSQSVIMGSGPRCFQLKEDLDLLKSLLPTEKWFARDMYEEGWVDRGYDRKSREEYFDLTYKQYEP